MKNKLGHTPGPWKIRGNTIVGQDPDALFGRTIAIIPGLGSDDKTDKISEANGNLLLLAPQMMEELENCALVLSDLAKHPAFADDAPEFNAGGIGYETKKSIRALLAQLKKV